MYGWALFISVFVATAVEAVEALTIVLAAGTARDWKSAFRGVYAGSALLALIIAIFGPAISRAPISVLRVLVGGLLLIFGLQWLRKAILRASGFKALHDEDRIYQEELQIAKAAKKESRIGVDDWFAFTLAFKGVVLEGLEIVFIVLTFGAIQKDIGLASIAALSAVAITVVAGFIVHKPLSKVPENTMKFIVGIMLTSFGIFWGVEGSGGHWPGDNVAVPIIIVSVALVCLAITRLYQLRHEALASTKQGAGQTSLPAKATSDSIVMKRLKAFGSFWYDFIIGDDWTVAALVVISFALTKSFSTHYTIWWLVPAVVVIALANSLHRATKKFT